MWDLVRNPEDRFSHNEALKTKKGKITTKTNYVACPENFFTVLVNIHTDFLERTEPCNQQFFREVKNLLLRLSMFRVLFL